MSAYPRRSASRFVTCTARYDLPARGMANLPPDIISEILSHLDKSTLAMCLRVSRSMLELAGAILYEELVINQHGQSKLSTTRVLYGVDKIGISYPEHGQTSFKRYTLKFVKRLVLGPHTESAKSVIHATKSMTNLDTLVLMSDRALNMTVRGNKHHHCLFVQHLKPRYVVFDLREAWRDKLQDVVGEEVFKSLETMVDKAESFTLIANADHMKALGAATSDVKGFLSRATRDYLIIDVSYRRSASYRDLIGAMVTFPPVDRPSNITIIGLTADFWDIDIDSTDEMKTTTEVEIEIQTKITERISRLNTSIAVRPEISVRDLHGYLEDRNRVMIDYGRSGRDELVQRASTTPPIARV